MAVADQANACVTSFTIPLDPHERLGPAGATPGVGDLLERRMGTPVCNGGSQRAHAAA